MKFKKHISILLAFVVILTATSYNFTIHYCKDTIASISFNTLIEKSNCKKESSSCCATKKNYKKCCSDKVVKVEKKKDTILSKNFKIGVGNYFLQKPNLFEILKNQIFYKSNKNVTFYCDSNAPPIYKLNCQLVFYA